jgi:GcrA cell cycle regulator
MSAYSAGQIDKRAAAPPKEQERKRTTNYPWDAERDAFVYEQARLGASAGKISKMLGQRWPNDIPPSRNAVVGKLSRAKGDRPPVRDKGGRPKPKSSYFKIDHSGSTAPTPVNSEALPPSNVVRLDVQTKEAARKLGPLAKSDGNPLSITDIRHGLCHYPIGDPKLPGFAYCGRAAFVKPCRRVGEDGVTPYCEDHRLLVYDPKEDQRRDNELKRIKQSLNRY